MRRNLWEEIHLVCHTNLRSLKNKMEMDSLQSHYCKDWHIRTEVQFCKWFAHRSVSVGILRFQFLQKSESGLSMTWCYWRHFIGIAIILWHLSIYLKYSCFIILNSVCNIVIIIWCFLHSGIFSLSLFLDVE